MGTRFISPPKIAIFIILISVVWCDLNTQRWKKEKAIIYWDVVSYYGYLPALFIYKDISLKFIDNYKGEHKFIFWPENTPIGGKCIKTTMGLSILYSPFFFMGHIVAKLTGYDTGGYSDPYKFFLMLSALFYLILGLLFLSKVLEKYFEPWIVAATLLIIVIATNLFYYSTIESTMSHSYSFSLISIFIYLTIKWHEKPSFKNSILIGLLTGLISLVRPTNIIIVLVFIFFNVVTIHQLKSRFSTFVSNYFKIIVIIICTLIIWLPQLFYWKTVSGSWLYNSYTNERFYFTHPHILEGLFGFRKGWLLYTPTIIFSLLGIPILFKRLKKFAWPILIFLILNIYIVLSWWAWWYGGGFGLRAFVDSYGLLAIPLAAFLEWAMVQKKYLKKIILASIFLISIKSIHYTFQYYYGAIHYDSMTKDAYIQSFWHTRPKGNYWNLLKAPDYDKARRGESD